MNNEYNLALGKHIAQLRKARKLTQDQLAAQLQVLGCDITRSALAKVEVGQRHLYPDELKGLKTALKVGYEDLFV